MPIFADFSNVTVNGCSQAGKSFTLKNILLNADTLFKTRPTLFIYVYEVLDESTKELKDKMQNILFLPTLPTERELSDLTVSQPHSVLVVDDLGSSLSRTEFLMKLYCYYTHHFKITAFLCTHDLASPGKYLSTMHKNTHCYLLISSPRDNTTLMSISRHSGNYRFLKDCFNDISQGRTRSHFLINYHPDTPKYLRYVTNIIPGQDKEPLTLYMERT